MNIVQSLKTRVVWNYENPQPKRFDLEDPHQAPNLAFFDFKPRTRAAVQDKMEKLYGKPPKGTEMIDLSKPAGERTFVKETVMVKDYLRDLRNFVSTWIDRYIKDGSLEVLPNGQLRRSIPPTMVHYSQPDDSDEDLSDREVTQAFWTQHPEFEADIHERWKPFKKVDTMTVGDVNKLVEKKISEATNTNV